MYTRLRIRKKTFTSKMKNTLQQSFSTRRHVEVSFLMPKPVNSTDCDSADSVHLH